MIRVGIIGGTGYTALELIRLLLRHPEVAITRLTSRDDRQPHVSEVHPGLRDRLDLRFETLELDDFSQAVDCAFCCLPHAASAEVVGPLLDRGVRVVDFSADYRLNDVPSFEKWYQVQHPDAARVGKVPYGIPELFRDEIQSADVVANPGCFPSSAILPLAPLFKHNLISDSDVIVDSKTGVSGAGRKANLRFHFPECNESVAAYGVGTHRHMPEIDQILHRFAGTSTNTIFTPHLIAMDRGILSTIYVQPAGDTTVDMAMDCLNDFYKREPFVRITSDLPTTKDVAVTNFCDITVRQCGNRLILISVLDNLIKGASGAAVQNFNVMFGYEETTALG